jgi:hypothetical protein
MTSEARHCEDIVKHARIISTFAGIAGVAGLTAGLAQVLPADGATARPQTAPKYVVTGCNGKQLTKPVSYTPFCADDGAGLQRMHWTSWTSHLASGYGTIYEDDNYPNHAEGKIYKVPGIVTFWGSARVNGHPSDRTYTKMTFIFPGKRPAVYKKVNGKWVATHPETQTLGF